MDSFLSAEVDLPLPDSDEAGSVETGEWPDDHLRTMIRDKPEGSYCSGEISKAFRCDNCGDIFEYEDDASDCCGFVYFECEECGTSHSAQDFSARISLGTGEHAEEFLAWSAAEACCGEDSYTCKCRVRYHVPEALYICCGVRL